MTRMTRTRTITAPAIIPPAAEPAELTSASAVTINKGLD